MRSRVTYVILALCVGCGDDGGGGGDGPDANGESSTVFAVGADYMAGTGIASAVYVPALTVRKGVAEDAAIGDPVVRQIGDRIYVVNREGFDSVTIVDARTFAVIGELSTGPGSNPQDVAVSDSTIYVAAMAAPGVLMLDANQSQQGVVAAIDLSSLDPEDGLPNCHSLHLAGERLLVACEILDDTVSPPLPRGPGKVAVIDVTTTSLVTTLELSTQNPLGKIVETPQDGALGGDLLVATVDFTKPTIGCIERISLDPEPVAEGCLVENASLGGYASGFAFADDESIRVAVTSGWDEEDRPIAGVVDYDLESGTVRPEPISKDGQSIFDLARCPSGQWVFADAAGGLRVYDAAGEELTRAPIDIGLPPVAGGTVCY